MVLPYMDHTISQNFKVSFPHQGVTFQVVGVLTEGL